MPRSAIRARRALDATSRLPEARLGPRIRAYFRPAASLSIVRKMPISRVRRDGGLPARIGRNATSNNAHPLKLLPHRLRHAAMQAGPLLEQFEIDPKRVRPHTFPLNLAFTI
jgi:hypothetical protein